MKYLKSILAILFLSQAVSAHAGGGYLILKKHNEYHSELMEKHNAEMAATNPHESTDPTGASDRHQPKAVTPDEREKVSDPENGRQMTPNLLRMN